MVRFSLIIALVVSHAAAARAGGFHITLIGARRLAMGANLASPDDASAIFHNPAGLAQQKGLQLQLGTGMTFLNTEFTLRSLDATRFPEINAPHCGEVGEPACRWPTGADGYYTEAIGPERYVGVIPFLGATYDLGELSPTLDDTTVGLALYAPGAYGADMPQQAPTAYYILSGLFVVAAATAAVGHKVSDTVSVGASLSYNYLRLAFDQKYSLADVLTPADAAPDLSAQLAQATVGDLRLSYSGQDHGMGVAAGVLVTPSSWLAFGASAAFWTGPTFEGDVTLEGLGSTNFGTPALPARELRELVRTYGFKLPTALLVEMPIPPFLGAGVTVTPASWLEFAFDVRLWLYTLYEKQRIAPRYADEPGEPPLTEASLSKDKGYGNSYDFSLGALVRPFAANRNIELMCGVSFDKSPVPDETFSIDSPSLDQLSFQAGVRAQVSERWQIAVSEMLDVYLRRDVRNSRTSPPTNVRGGGHSHIPAIEARYRF